MQNSEFTDALKQTNCDVIVYLQANMSNKSDLLYWSVCHPIRMIEVLPIESMMGNNMMGNILMTLREKHVIGS